MRAVLANHPDAAAQQVHWDQLPTKQFLTTDRAVERTVGSAMLALYPTRIYIYPCSNKFTAGKKFIPVTLVIPAGCILMFTTMAHAGYGVWAEDQALYRPVPSADDYLAVNTLSWIPRVHFHITRGEKSTPKSNMMIPDHTVRTEDVGGIINYIELDHTEEPPLFKPPVFHPPSMQFTNKHHCSGTVSLLPIHQ